MKNLAFIPVFLLVTSVISAQQLAVPGEYSTIQAAIDAAAEGDTVLVDEGTYLENINFLGKAITVGSMFLLDGNEDHIANTIIDGSEPDDPDKGSVVTLNSGEDTTSVLCGFTITGGSGSLIGGAAWGIETLAGGGVLMHSSGGKVISNHIVDNHLKLNNASKNHLVTGAGIAGLRSGLKLSIIRNNIIEKDSITTTEHGYGAGIFLAVGSEGKIDNNTIAGNKIHASKNAWGGGIHIMQWASDQDYPIYITNNNIYENTAYSTRNGKGGGLFLSDCTDTTIVLSNNLVHNNSSVHTGGGVYLLYGSICEMYNNTLHNNSTEGNGNNLAINANCPVWMYNNILSTGIENEVPDFKIFDGDGDAINVISNMLAEDLYVNPQVYEMGNIVGDPEYADDQFNLSESSVAVGRGMDSITVDGIVYYGPRFDHYGIDRKLASTDQLPDIGAVESGYERSVCDYNTASVIRVPEEQSTIQGAIDAAADGDTVLVSEGRYFENINFKGKPITVASAFIIEGEEFYRGRTIIDGSQSANPDTASVVTMWSGEDTASVLNGLTITGGSGTLFNNIEGDEFGGGGILIMESGGKIVNNIIADNHVTADLQFKYGGGILAVVDHGKTAIVRENEIRYNSVLGANCYGGGAAFINGAILCEGNSVVGNEVGTGNLSMGGGVFWVAYKYDDPKKEVIIRNNAILGNVHTTTGGNEWGGGGIGTSFGFPDVNAQIYNNLISKNAATRGGGVLFFDTNLDVFNNVIVKNSASSSGGGYYTRENRHVSYNNIIAFNEAVSKGNNLRFGSLAEGIFFNNIIWDDSGNGLDNVNIASNSVKLHAHNNILSEVIFSDKIVQVDNTYMSPKLDDEYVPKSNSPAIGRGVESVEIAGVLYHAPALDMAGNPRPNGVDEHVDIGAFETSEPLSLYGNAFLKELRFGDYELYPEYSKYTSEYIVSEEACDSDLDLAEAFPEDALATFEINHAIVCDDLTIITVASSDGSKERVYSIGFDTIPGVDEVLVDKLPLYPNPFSSYTILELPVEECIERIELLDMTGKTVRIIEEISEFSVRISRENLPPGVYLLYVQGEKHYLNKVIIE